MRFKRPIDRFDPTTPSLATATDILSVMEDINDVTVISWEPLHRFLRSLAYFVELIHAF